MSRSSLPTRRTRRLRSAAAGIAIAAASFTMAACGEEEGALEEEGVVEEEGVLEEEEAD